MDATILSLLDSDCAALAERLRRGVLAVRSRAGAGSATAWLSEGIAVTNSHVVSGERADVVTHDERVFAASVIARDRARDLAVLRTDAPLEPLEVGDTRSLRSGQLVLAVGNPWGERGAVTAGIIMSTGSSAGHGVPALDAIRADITLAPGNSGGPLADATGRILGVCSMVAGGMAVAVRADAAARLVAETSGQRGVLGIAARPVPLSETDGTAKTGLLVTEVAAGSPAERSGLIPGDVVVSLDGLSGGLDALAAALRSLRMGAPVRVDVLRGGMLQTFEAVPARAA